MLVPSTRSKPYSLRFLENLSLIALMIVVPGITISLPLWVWGWKLHGRNSGKSLSETKLSFRRFIVLLYLWWMWTQRRVQSLGGRPYQFVRNLGIWNYFRSYFSMKVIRDYERYPATVPRSSLENSHLQAEFDPKKKFIIGVHPHGVLSVGTVGNIISHNPETFPKGLDYRVLTVSLNFYIPVWRDLLLAFGLVDAHKESVSYLLKNGISVVSVIGGAQEALDSRPGANDLTLKNRKGFVRLALENGAALVPVFTFGETDIFDQILPNPPGSRTRKIQELCMSWFGYSIPLVIGRWLFGIPKRVPLTLVVGTPIDVKMDSCPSENTVNYWHEIYLRELNRLYDTYKFEASSSPPPPLRIIDAPRPKI